MDVLTGGHPVPGRNRPGCATSSRLNNTRSAEPESRSGTPPNITPAGCATGHNIEDVYPEAPAADGADVFAFVATRSSCAAPPAPPALVS